MSRVKLAGARIARGLHRAFGDRSRAASILAYHHVHPRTAGIPAAEFNVEPERFRTQLKGLQDAGFTFVPLGSLIEAHHHETSLPDKAVVVTFDDGFESVYQCAFPILRELQIPSTVFLATAYLDGTRPLSFDPWGSRYWDQLSSEHYRPLTSAQCEEMQASGLVELGVHTHTHQDFRNRPHDLHQDILRSVELVSCKFGVARPSFAFPFGRRHLGYCGGALTEAARLAGVRCALTTDCGNVLPQQDPFSWGRFNCYNHDDGPTLAAKCTGWYSWITQVQTTIDRFRGRSSPAPSSLLPLAVQPSSPTVSV